MAVLEDERGVAKEVERLRRELPHLAIVVVSRNYDARRGAVIIASGANAYVREGDGVPAIVAAASEAAIVLH